MTNEIIIDNVNVAECEYLKYVKPTGFAQCNCDGYGNTKTKSLECVKNPNCHFKQLQRLKQENEKLEASNNTSLSIIANNDKIIDKLFHENTQLKQKNEELEKENNYLKEYRKHSSTCQECYEDGYNDGLVSNKTLKQYQQTLKEIGEAVENCINPEYPIYKQILQKVKEVIE